MRTAKGPKDRRARETRPQKPPGARTPSRTRQDAAYTSAVACARVGAPPKATRARARSTGSSRFAEIAAQVQYAPPSTSCCAASRSSRSTPRRSLLARPLAPSTTRPSPGKMSPRTPRTCSVDSPTESPYATIKKNPTTHSGPTSSGSSLTIASTWMRRSCEFPPRPRRPARRATDPRRRRHLEYNEFDGGPSDGIPHEIGELTALTYLRVPAASPTPGAARDRPSAS